MEANARRAFAVLRTAIFTVVPYVVGIWLPVRVHWAYTLPTDTSASRLFDVILGLVFLIGGIALYCWCAWDFAVKGFGSPAPIDAPRTLVVAGPYRHVRNPMYLAVLIVIASQAISWRSFPTLIYLVFIACWFELFVIVYEEPHLRRVFGTQYENYSRSVNRWLPRLSAK